MSSERFLERKHLFFLNAYGLLTRSTSPLFSLRTSHFESSDRISNYHFIMRKNSDRIGIEDFHCHKDGESSHLSSYDRIRNNQVVMFRF